MLKNVFFSSFFVILSSLLFVISDSIINYLSPLGIKFYHHVFYGLPGYIIVPIFFFKYSILKRKNKKGKNIKGKDYDYKKLPFNNKVIKQTTIGRLMVRLKADEPKMQSVQNFIDKHRCSKND